MPQPGTNGMEPVFGEAYGSHRGLLTSEPFTVCPLGGRTEYDQESPQSVVLMLGTPVAPRKRPFELLSDLVDDGFSEDLHHERWDISALDDIARYTKVGLEGELASSESVSLRRGGGEEEPPASGGEQAAGPGGQRTRFSPSPRATDRRTGMGVVPKPTDGTEPGAPCQKFTPKPTVEEVLQPPEAPESSPSALEHCSEEHNYSLHAERDSCTSQGSDSETGDTEEEEEEEEEEEDEDEGAEEEEDAAEGRDSSFSGAECDQDPDSQVSERPKKRRCFWEYSHGHEAGCKREGGELPLSWSPSTLPSTLYLREDTSANGKKSQRKARKTDASDLTPNPQKLCHIGDQLHKLNAAIEGMRPMNDLAVIARARSRKEKNKLASRACRLKKKAQHEANKIKLWGLNQEYDSLLGALLRIKEVIRQRVESAEQEQEAGMTQKLESILRESAGPCVAGQTKEFVEKILERNAAGQETKRPQKKDPSA